MHDASRGKDHIEFTNLTKDVHVVAKIFASLPLPTKQELCSKK